MMAASSAAMARPCVATHAEPSGLGTLSNEHELLMALLAAWIIAPSLAGTAPRTGRPKAKVDGREALRGRRPIAIKSRYEK
jgi:hypothetical protein